MKSQNIKFKYAEIMPMGFAVVDNANFITFR